MTAEGWREARLRGTSADKQSGRQIKTPSKTENERDKKVTEAQTELK